MVQVTTDGHPHHGINFIYFKFSQRMKKFIFAVLLTVTFSLVASEVSAQVPPSRTINAWNRMSTRAKTYATVGVLTGGLGLPLVVWFDSEFGYHFFKLERFPGDVTYDRFGRPKMTRDDLQVWELFMTAEEEGVDVGEIITLP